MCTGKKVEAAHFLVASAMVSTQVSPQTINQKSTVRSMLELILLMEMCINKI